MNIDHLFEPLHPTVIHCVGVPGSSRDFFINCLAHHPAVHINLGQYYLFSSPEDQRVFLSRQLSAVRSGGSVGVNRVRTVDPELLQHCAARGLVTVAASNSVDSFDSIREQYPAARTVMTRATVEYLGTHADQYESQSLLLGRLIGNHALQVDSDRFLVWESFLATWQWTVGCLGLDLVDDGVIAALREFHRQYITTKSSVVPAQE
jgi:hypothetical protein